MTPIIDIPEFNEELEFPDEMSNSDIKQEVEKYYKQRKNDSISDTKPFKNIYSEENQITAASDLIKKYGPYVITAGQIGIQLSPLGKAAALITAGTEFGGEFSKSLIRKEDFLTATEKGATAAGIDLATRVFLGIPAKAIFSKFLTSNIKPKEFSEEIVNIIKQNPKLTSGVKETYDDISSLAVNSIKNKKKEIGTMIGKLKSMVEGKDIRLDISPLKSNVDEMIKDLKIPISMNQTNDLISKGILPINDPSGIKAIQTINSEIDKILMRNGTKEVALEKIVSPINPGDLNTGFVFKQSLENLETMIKNIDNSKPFQKIYTKLADQFSPDLTIGEKAALGLRRNIREFIDNNIADDLVKNKLILNREAFTDLSRSLDFPGIQNALSKGNMFSLLQKSLRSGSRDLFDNLAKIDSSLSDKNKFMMKFIAKEAGEKIGTVIDPIINAVQFRLSNAITSSTGLLARTMLTKPGQSLGGLLRRGTAQLGSEAIEPEKIQQQPIQEQRVSLNQIVYQGISKPK